MKKPNPYRSPYKSTGLSAIRAVSNPPRIGEVNAKRAKEKDPFEFGAWEEIRKGWRRRGKREGKIRPCPKKGCPFFIRGKGEGHYHAENGVMIYYGLRVGFFNYATTRKTKVK